MGVKETSEHVLFECGYRRVIERLKRVTLSMLGVSGEKGN